MSRKILFCILGSLLFFGCVKVVPAPSIYQMKSADYGPSPGGVSFVRNYLHQSLVDPYSIRDLKIVPPAKCWYQPNEYKSPEFGYCSFATFNSKNRMGGYVGLRTYLLFIQDGYVFAFTDHYLDWQYGIVK